MMKFNSEMMNDVFSSFGVDYNYPVYMSFFDNSSFFSNGRNLKFGYLAVNSSSDVMYLAEYSALRAIAGSDALLHEIQFGLIKKIKVKKMLLLPSYKINIEGRMLDGKKYRYKMVINKKVGGGHFPDQEENSLSLINILSSLS